MVVKSRQQEVDPKSPTGLSDKEDQDPQSDSRIYANLFTQYYDEIAKIEPQYARLKELAKLLVIVKHIYEHGVEVDIDYIEKSLH